eukprot:6748247-Ditylum_brightwellii.AAC.1
MVVVVTVVTEAALAVVVIVIFVWSFILRGRGQATLLQLDEMGSHLWEWEEDIDNIVDEEKKSLFCFGVAHKIDGAMMGHQWCCSQNIHC